MKMREGFTELLPPKGWQQVMAVTIHEDPAIYSCIANFSTRRSREILLGILADFERLAVLN